MPFGHLAEGFDLGPENDGVEKARGEAHSTSVFSTVSILFFYFLPFLKDAGLRKRRDKATPFSYFCHRRIFH
jgi:hypothetical protein